MKQMTGTVSQSCSTLWNSMDCTPPGSSVCRILQARMLEWVAISFSMESSRPRDRICVSCIAAVFFNRWASREALVVVSSLKKRMQLNKTPNGISTLPTSFSLHNHECWTKGTYLLHFNSHLPETLCLFQILWFLIIFPDLSCYNPILFCQSKLFCITYAKSDRS